MCACVHKSWQHPAPGEASTCPVPEQGAGAAAHPQPGRPDSGERNEGGGLSCPGGLAQEPGGRVFGDPKSQPLTVLQVDKPRSRGGQSLPIGAETRARIDFILLGARQRKVDITFRWRHFPIFKNFLFYSLAEQET